MNCGDVSMFAIHSFLELNIGGTYKRDCVMFYVRFNVGPKVMIFSHTWTHMILVCVCIASVQVNSIESITSLT